MEGVQIPNHTASIFTAAHELISSDVVDSDGCHSSLVLLHRCHEIASILKQIPHADGAVVASGDKQLAVFCACEGADGAVMRILTLEEQRPALWSKDTHTACAKIHQASDASRNPTVAPAAQDSAAVAGEVKTVAFQIGHDDAQKLPAALEVPDANIANAAGREDGAVVVWEHDVVNLAAVRRLQQLLGKPNLQMHHLFPNALQGVQYVCVFLLQVIR